MFNSALYKYAPYVVQNVCLSARSAVRELIRGSFFSPGIYAQLERNQWLGQAELMQLQLDEVRYVLKLAKQSVPYYRDLFDEYNLDPDRIQDLNTLTNFPLLTKSEVKAHSGRLLVESFRGPRLRTRTSGTTGSPLTSYQSLCSIIRENAFIARQLQWAGYYPGAGRAWIRGDMIVPLLQSEPPYWRKNALENMLMMSSFHLSEGAAPLYIGALEEHDPLLIQAYPSSIFYLARYLESNDLFYNGKNLQSIVTSSETIDSEQKRIIEERMGAKVYDWYGLNERVCAIGTCEKGSYHIMSDYGLLETLPGEGEGREIVGTGFGNYLFPLIRYRTGDTLVFNNTAGPCPCGRQMPVVQEIIGRKASYIKTPDGRRVARMSTIFYNVNTVVEAQIIQKTINEIQVLVVTDHNFSAKDEKTIRDRALGRVGEGVEVAVIQVDQIKRTKSGKFRDIISHC